MTSEKLNTAVYKKMFAEQERFKEYLLRQPPEEILRHAYEYAVREDILMSMECNDVSDEQAKALLMSEDIIAEVFHDFEKIEGDHMETVQHCIEDRANAIFSRFEQYATVPLVLCSRSEAEANGTLADYDKSLMANIACKDAIEQLCNSHYDGTRFDGRCAGIAVETFGYERVAFVLASTIEQKEWDGRFSGLNKAWAKSVPLGNDLERRQKLTIDKVHPGVLDLFAQYVRNGWGPAKLEKAVPTKPRKKEVER